MFIGIMRLFSKQNISRFALSVVWVAFGSSLAEEGFDCSAVKEAIVAAEGPNSADIDRCIANAGRDDIVLLLETALKYRDEDHAVALVANFKAGDYSLELLRLAAFMELATVVERFLDSNPKLIDATDGAGRGALSSASLGRSYMSAQAILKTGLPRDLPKALEIASARSREIAYLILEHTEAVDAQQVLTGRILGIATQYGDEAYISYLLSKGLDPNATDENGQPAILYAAHHDDSQQGERNWHFLVRHGASAEMAICGIRPSAIQGIEQYAPDWFSNRVAKIYPTCP